jgi:hypothetical protein
MKVRAFQGVLVVFQATIAVEIHAAQRQVLLVVLVPLCPNNAIGLLHRARFNKI